MKPLEEIYKELSLVNGVPYIPQDFATNIHNEHGFLSYYLFMNRNGDRAMYIDGLYAPHQNKYWQEVWDEIAKKNQCKYIVFNTKREPKLIKKLFGFELSTYTYVKEVE